SEFDSDFGAGKFFSASFAGINNIPTTMFLCKAPKGLLNFSTNPSYTHTVNGKTEITTKYPKTYITTVGVYDEDRKLLGVAKVSSPVLNEEDASILFKLKLVY